MKSWIKSNCRPLIIIAVALLIGILGSYFVGVNQNVSNNGAGMAIPESEKVTVSKVNSGDIYIEYGTGRPVVERDGKVIYLDEQPSWQTK